MTQLRPPRQRGRSPLSTVELPGLTIAAAGKPSELDDPASAGPRAQGAPAPARGAEEGEQLASAPKRVARAGSPLHTWRIPVPFSVTGLGGADREMAKARLQRRSFPIRACVGPNGTGKSALAVYDLLPSLEWGRPVLSTVRLLDYLDPRECPGGAACDDPPNHVQEKFRTDVVADPETGAPVAMRTGTGIFTTHRAAHPLYVPFRSYPQLLEFRDGDVLMDEVTGLASSRESSGMPPQVANMLVQLRRRNVTLTWTTPSWGRADKIIREVTQAVTLTSAFLPRRVKQTPGLPPVLWRQRRLFWAQTYDGQSFDEFDAHRAHEGEVDPIIRALYWGPGARMFSAYDTYDAVTALGWSNEAGMCMNCGGKRLARKCGCDDHAGTPAPAAPRTRRPRAAK